MLYNNRRSSRNGPRSSRRPIGSRIRFEELEPRLLLSTSAVDEPRSFGLAQPLVMERAGEMSDGRGSVEQLADRAFVARGTVTPHPGGHRTRRLDLRGFAASDTDTAVQATPHPRHPGRRVTTPGDTVVLPLYVVDHRRYTKGVSSESSTGSFGYYTPSQIRQAYGFAALGATANGTGQTIAIVDAGDDPTIASDLATFDSTFGVPAPPSFVKANQTGGVQYPAPIQGWSTEIALDVEWAHAMAPGAKILLVEANSTSNADLYAAVNYARNQPGVSVVSMSWGQPEFSGETSDDALFTAPTGHAGITFVAATGDSGTAPGYPAVSPNVVAVGGTTLYLNPNNSRAGESGWTGSSGGISVYEPVPSYQRYDIYLTHRTAPDVAYDADPYNGFEVYDSYGAGGFEGVGGTSAGAPQWAALIAIADQGRAQLGKGPLNTSQTLSYLYDFNSNLYDIVSGNNVNYKAGLGYDLVTGLGTPNVPNVVYSLETGMRLVRPILR